MKRLLLVFTGMYLILSTGLVAQVMNDVLPRDHIVEKKPVPLPQPREADIMWSKQIWRVMDLREKINQPFYYPVVPVDNRYSLIDLLMKGIENNDITAYSSKTEDEFEKSISFSDVLAEFDASQDTITVQDVTTGEWVPRVVKSEARTDQVKQYIVKEVWYFDRSSSTLNVRIVGFCPIRFYTREGSEEIVRKKLFWVYYPEARDVFARHEVYNPNNDAERRSFDDLFLKRRFGSYIIQESNIYGNRSIDQYAVGVDAILESERIKKEIFEFEQNLWEY